MALQAEGATRYPDWQIPCADLDGDESDRLVEQADYVEEPAGDVLCDDDRNMIALRLTGLLDVPVLDRADDVRLVGGTQLQLYLVTSAGIGVR